MVFFLMPLNILIGRKTRDLSQQQMKLKDERINLTNEALLGVKLIKLYGWEEPFQKRISGLIDFRLFLSPLPVHFRSASGSLPVRSDVIIKISEKRSFDR